ncbi:MAG TPA: hypothetical protein VF791_13140, partial [Pyrinomonadaceae bacterium]
MSFITSEAITEVENARAAQLPEQYSLAAALEQYLGDPSDERNPFSFAHAVELDEREQYPEQACALLDAWGLP